MTIFDWQQPLDDPDGKGLYLRSRRGQIGEGWWSRQWLEPIEAAAERQVLELGRRLARRSQVLELRIQSGVITARVEETRERTHVVTFRIPVIAAAESTRLLDAIARDNLMIAHLYAGRLPKALTTIFASTGTELCPAPVGRQSCACGAAELCCHAVAAACVVAEYFDKDPFALLAFRGLSRLDVINAVRRHWGAGEIRHATQEAVVPLNSLKQSFYDTQDELPTNSGALQLPLINVLTLLGPPPFFPPGDHHMNQTVSDLYSD